MMTKRIRVKKNNLNLYFFDDLTMNAHFSQIWCISESKLMQRTQYTQPYTTPKSDSNKNVFPR